MNPEKLKKEAQERAKEDLRKHLIIHTNEEGEKYQVSINPYSTEGARYEWERGFNNEPLLSYQGHPDFNERYLRGRAMAELIQNQTKEQEAGK